jgi:ABC-type multidrug transport system fused ATPase/permease subunit
VVDHGNVIQRGSESDLLSVDGPFRRLAHDLRSVG